ncbi:DUF368 domain-containing protein [Saccharobesus litoralis]|uniref:DUF368 domain-containing protein n=2 Tax=Saccharobesus litoralis TaxID=2172099 RepID=A0A2S0VXU6_9ALTE|nr:DUF368 domain-containing protein [Saccharobesus litoralis]
MGAADVVPGVSGGTIAFISGIYDELLKSLKQLGPNALTILFKQGFAEFWRHINGGFLLAVFAGILISVKTFASLISFALDNHPILIWSFFSGLIAASVYLLAKQQTNWRPVNYISLLIGIGIVYIISISTPSQLPSDWWFLFLGGFIAICAMILPGVSGSFILLLLGLYSVALNAVKNMDLIALAAFGFGCIAGLMVFSRFLSWLLDRYYQTTIALLIGFLIGSLNVTWPWKQVVSTYVNRHGETVPLIRENVLPSTFSNVYSTDSQLIFALLASLFGILLVISIELIASKLKR